MASSKGYLDFILEQISELDDVTYRAMMGEYIIYYRGKVVGGIYDDRFLVKPTKSAVVMFFSFHLSCNTFCRVVPDIDDSVISLDYPAQRCF